MAKLRNQINFKRKGGRHLIGISGREIETRGLADGFWTDLYHRSMTVYWPTFFGTAAAIFVVLNAIFAFLYWLGNEPIANVAGNEPLGFFISRLRRWPPSATATCIRRPTTGISSPRSKSSPACRSSL